MSKVIINKPKTGDKYADLEVIYSFFQKRSMLQVRCSCQRCYAIAVQHWGKVKRCKACSEAKRRAERIQQRERRKQRDQKAVNN